MKWKLLSNCQVTRNNKISLCGLFIKNKVFKTSDFTNVPSIVWFMNVNLLFCLPLWVLNVWHAIVSIGSTFLCNQLLEQVSNMHDDDESRWDAVQVCYSYTLFKLHTLVYYSHNFLRWILWAYFCTVMPLDKCPLD